MMGFKKMTGHTAAPFQGVTSAKAPSMGVSRANYDTGSLANNLFDRIDESTPKGTLYGRTLLVLGAKPECLQFFRGWLADLGVSVRRVETCDDMLAWLERNPTAKALALINADSLEDADALCDIGFALRESAPDLPLIVTSSKVAASDFSTLRMQLCDVTLKAPASESSFQQACLVALSNNAFYRGRSVTPQIKGRASRAPLLLTQKPVTGLGAGWKSALTVVSACATYVAYGQNVGS